MRWSVDTSEVGTMWPGKWNTIPNFSLVTLTLSFDCSTAVGISNLPEENEWLSAARADGDGQVSPYWSHFAFRMDRARGVARLNQLP